MIRPTPLWRSAAVLGVAGLVLTACGGSSDTASTTRHASPARRPRRPAPRATARSSIGTLLPQTGSLAFLGPPEFAGVDLAVKDINDAGGVNGKQVEVVDSDSGDTSTDTASQSVDRLLSQQRRRHHRRRVVQRLALGDRQDHRCRRACRSRRPTPPTSSPTTPTRACTSAPPRRTSCRAGSLGDLILADGNTTVGILALQDSYGTGLADNATKSRSRAAAARSSRRSSTTRRPRPSPPRSARSRRPTPRRSSVIAFDETKKIIPELVKQGIGPDKKKIYFVDGNLADYGKDFPKGTLDGRQGHPARRRGR